MSRMTPEIAYRHIKSFDKSFGEAHLYLACHAALPIALTPDLLYLLWKNFQRDINGEQLNIPWIAVADLLLSGLCHEVGHELYEMDLYVRNNLLEKLQENQNFGKKRINKISNFLLEYIKPYLSSQDQDIQDLAQAQELTALAYLNPSQAARKLTLLLVKTDQQDTTELLRITSLVETLAEPLIEYKELIIYSRGIANYLRGKVEDATVNFLEIIGNKSDLNLNIAGINFPIPEQIKNNLSVVETSPKKSLPIISGGFSAIVITAFGNFFFFQQVISNNIPTPISTPEPNIKDSTLLNNTNPTIKPTIDKDLEEAINSLPLVALNQPPIPIPRAAQTFPSFPTVTPTPQPTITPGVKNRNRLPDYGRPERRETETPQPTITPTPQPTVKPIEGPSTTEIKISLPLPTTQQVKEKNTVPTPTPTPLPTVTPSGTIRNKIPAYGRVNGRETGTPQVTESLTPNSTVPIPTPTSQPTIPPRPQVEEPSTPNNTIPNPTPTSQPTIPPRPQIEEPLVPNNTIPTPTPTSQPTITPSPGNTTQQNPLITRGEIVQIHGQVTLLRRNQPARDAKVGDVLVPSDELTTGRASIVDIRFNDGSLGRIGERATFRLKLGLRRFQLPNIEPKNNSASLGVDKIEDIKTTQEEIAAELANLRGKLDSLEARMTELETNKNQNYITNQAPVIKRITPEEINSIRTELSTLDTKIDNSTKTISDFPQQPNSNIITTEDIKVLKRLNEEFKLVLSTMQNRYDALLERFQAVNK